MKKDIAGTLQESRDRQVGGGGGLQRGRGETPRSARVNERDGRDGSVSENLFMRYRERAWWQV